MLPPNFLDELRARTPIAAIIGRTVKLARSGREQKGCCPFHGEKTPSFYVYDDHYHCFGCGEHGDVITFVMKSTGASFMEAVEDLARQAGLEVPKPTPQAAELEQRRAGLAEVLAEAAKTYQKWLFEPQGAPALAYLRGRGLSDETVKKFGLGWSGEGRGALTGALRGKNIKPDQLTEAGLMKQGDFGPVDMFFARVMFPIRDRRGQIISFGGRVLGDAQPKYVNGPETAIFSKRRALYGLDLARDPVRKGAALIVTEGYMDVIALHQAGFLGAVAPLGTALTEDHLAELWRLAPQPIICFDGDAAGQRAALKTADLALSLLGPDRSLAFLHLPPKDDPDSLIRREGAAAFQARLEAARPLSAALYDMLAAAHPRATPEARAGFRHRLAETAGRIQDKALASEYRAMLMDRFFAERRTGRAAKPAAAPPARPVPDPSEADLRRIRLMLAALFARPDLFPDVEEAFAHLLLPPAHDRLRTALGDFIAVSRTLDRASLLTHLDGLGLAEAARAVENSVLAEEGRRFDPEQNPVEAARNWWSWYNHMDAIVQILHVQRQEALDYYQAHQDDRAAYERLKKYTELLQQAQAGEYGTAEG